MRLRLREATSHSIPTQWGVYIERNDGLYGVDDWLPLIYDAENKRHALGILESFGRGTRYRNHALIKRTVTPWKEAK